VNFASAVITSQNKSREREADRLTSKFDVKAVLEEGDVDFWLCLAATAYELVWKATESALVCGRRNLTLFGTVPYKTWECL